MAAAPTPPPDLSRLRLADSDRATEPAGPRRSPVGMLVGVIVGLALAWFGRDAMGPAAPSSGANAPAVVTAAGATTLTEPATSGAPGSVMAGGRVESTARRELVFAQAGVVASVKVVRGQRVKAGEVLMELESSAEKAAVQEQLAALESMRARSRELSEGARPEELEQARRDLEAAIAVASDADEKAAQATELARAGSVAKSQVQEARRTAEAARARAQAAQARLSLVERGSRRTSLASAESEVARAQAQLQKAQARLLYTRLVAPADGTVVDVRVRTGEATAPDQAAPVILSDLSHLDVKVDVPEAKATRVRVGDAATITVEALPDVRFKGRVKEIGLEADRQKGTLEVTVAFEDGSDLSAVRPRMAARATIEVARTNN